MKVGLIMPCIGVGGADALALGLIKHCHNVEFTGCAVTKRIQNADQVNQARKFAGTSIPFHAYKSDFDDVIKHKKRESAVNEVCRDADIVLSWGVPNVLTLTKDYNIPVIDYAQNTNNWQREISASNKDVICKAACSKAVAENVYQDTLTPIRIICNGIDPSRVTPRLGRERQRQVWNIAKERKVLLHMGRLVPEKHPEYLLEALRYLPDEWIGIYCGAGEMQKNLYQEAQRSLHDRVFFVKPQYHVGDILATSDLFLLLSDYEGMPLALLEAWLAGVPTLYSDMAFTDELEADYGPMGTKISKVPSIQLLQQGVFHATQETDENGIKRMNAKSVVWNNFTLPHIAWQWENYFNQCVTGHFNQKVNNTIYPVNPPTECEEEYREPTRDGGLQDRATG